MKHSRHRRPAPTRAQVHQILNKVVHDHASHLTFVPPVSRDLVALFEWAEEDEIESAA